MSARVVLVAGCLATVGCFRGFETPLSAAPAASSAPPAAATHASAEPHIPEGPACLALLDGLEVQYRALDAKRGVETPIEVQGPLAGVRYFTWGDAPLVMSCRLAVALTWVGPILSSHGITEVRHSGAYVYRASRKTGRLSLHAHGLAIDLHAFSFGDGSSLSVQRGYAAGRTNPCAGPVLNHLACSLSATGLFRELLTPDRDADHHDHFHLAIAPMGGTRSAPPPSPLLARRNARPAKRYPPGRAKRAPQGR